MAEKKERDADWMQKLWRPAMGWMYMLICMADMIIFPVLWALWQGINHVPITQWNPLTLQGAGLFHIAMGAVLGISAFGRTQEKLAGTAANPTATEQISLNTTNMSGVPAGGMNNGMGGMNNGMGGMNNGMGGGFGGSTGGMGGGFGGSSGGFNNGNSTAPTTGFSSGAPAFGAPAAGGFGSSSGGFGSPAPATGGFGSAPASGGFGATTPTATVTPPAPMPTPSTVAVTPGFGGKKAPAPQDDPIL
jgi:hypothetical protein